MSSIASMVVATVNVPFGPIVTVEQLAAKLVSWESVTSRDPSVGAFFSDVPVNLQRRFIFEMNLDGKKVAEVAKGFQEMMAYPLELASDGDE